MNNIVSFSNKAKLKSLTDLKKIIVKTINFTLEYEGFSDLAEISVTLIDNEGIGKLNNQFRNKEYPTDVLSFPASEFDEELELNPETNAYFLGDVVISVEMAEKQAAEYGHSLEREVAFLTVHSILHLLGFDHEISKDEEQIMFGKQEEILNKLGYIRK